METPKEMLKTVMNIKKCRCGKIAIAMSSIPVNVYSGARRLSVLHPTCEYHTNKCIDLGYRTIPI
jgi:hypothetical protein